MLLLLTRWRRINNYVITMIIIYSIGLILTFFPTRPAPFFRFNIHFAIYLHLFCHFLIVLVYIVNRNPGKPIPIYLCNREVCNGSLKLNLNERFPIAMKFNINITTWSFCSFCNNETAEQTYWSTRANQQAMHLLV